LSYSNLYILAVVLSELKFFNCRSPIILSVIHRVGKIEDINKRYRL